MENKVYKIAILASGAGSNAKNLILDSRKDSNKVYKVELVITNNKDAGVINICRQLGVSCFLWKKDSFLSPDFLISSLKNNSIDYIILAGFLLKISDKIIENFPKKIINIHPSLLPKYGGNGMYGNKVHQAVLDNKEKESGITIHFVNEHYDEGEIISQKKISLNELDTIYSLKEKINSLEHEEFSKTLRLIFK
jgi:phosphoribosylglycinamide formyltransferase-1